MVRRDTSAQCLLPKSGRDESRAGHAKSWTAVSSVSILFAHQVWSISIQSWALSASSSVEYWADACQSELTRAAWNAAKGPIALICRLCQPASFNSFFQLGCTWTQCYSFSCQFLHLSSQNVCILINKRYRRERFRCQQTQHQGRRSYSISRALNHTIPGFREIANFTKLRCNTR